MATPDAGAPATRPVSGYGALPMSFEPNEGQTDARVRFLARGAGYTVFLTDAEAVLRLGAKADDPTGAKAEAASSAVLRMRWAGAAARPRVTAEQPLEGHANYFVGTDREAWREGVATYGRVRYEGVCDGVDAVVYGTQQHLEYDFVVAPGADPSQVRVRFEGADRIEVDESGDLLLSLPGGVVRQQRAAVFQQSVAGKRAVAARYVVGAGGEVGFDLGDYDPAEPLVIDPVVVYSDFIGGSAGEDGASAMALTPSNEIVVVGYTESTNFPVTADAVDTTHNDTDGFVAKLNASGTAFALSTYLGGSLADSAESVAVDGAGAIYIAGFTQSSDYPVTAGAADTTYNGSGDVSVTKLSADGTAMVYSTFIGGSDGDFVGDIAVVAGAAYVTGETGSQDFPTTAGAYDTTIGGFEDVFAAKLNTSGSSLAYATYLGGNITESGSHLAVDPNGGAVVAGRTDSMNFPTTTGAYSTSFNGGDNDLFVAKLNTQGTALAWATYLGGSGNEFAGDVALDAAANVYVVGEQFDGGFPTTPGAFQSTPHGEGDGIVAKLSSTGASLLYATYLGGATSDSVNGIAVDPAGVATVAGTTTSADFPTTGGAFDTTFNGKGDGFATRLNATGTALVFSTFVGGSRDDTVAGVAVDGTGAVYIAGNLASADFSTAVSLTGRRPDGRDVFAMKLSPTGSDAVYAEFFGGDVGVKTFDSATDVAVDAAGAAYIVGFAGSLNFPTTPGVFEETAADTDNAFVAKVAPSGNALAWSTYLGGTRHDTAFGVALGANGTILVGGETASPDFPTTAGAYDPSYNGVIADDIDVFVTRLGASDGSLVASTYLGAAGGDSSTALVSDPNGAAYIVGSTRSAGFPTTPGAFDTTITGGNVDAFVSKLSPTLGALSYSTFLGGTSVDSAFDVAVDASGQAYVTGETFDPTFPTTPGAYDTTHNGGPDAFVTKVNVTGTGLVYSTFLGTSVGERSYAIAVDSAGAAYVTGVTTSSDFPTTPGAYDTTFGGVQDMFVTKLNAAGTGLVYSTFLGGSDDDSAYEIAVDASGVAYVVGKTASGDFPTTPNAFDASRSGAVDGTLTKVSPTGASLVYSTFIGGSSSDAAYGIALDPARSIYVVGEEASPDFPVSGAFGAADESTAFIVKFAVAADTVGLYVPATGAWFVRNTNAAGPADRTFVYGPPNTVLPLVGDWDGDGDATPGLYAPATGAFFLKNTSAAGPADVVFTFGAGGAGLIPLSGDWNGDGTDTIGLYNTTTGTFFLRNTNSAGGADLAFSFGAGGAELLPLAGDWNGDGTDTIGLYVVSTGAFLLRNTNGSGPADVAFTFGAGGNGLQPITGDWNGDGTDTAGLYAVGSGSFFLRNANAPGAADVVFTFGGGGATAVAGNWAG